VTPLVSVPYHTMVVKLDYLGTLGTVPGSVGQAAAMPACEDASDAPVQASVAARP
jgi:uncharacterized transporter YbjL